MMPDDLPLGDPRVTGLPVEECGEPLVDLHQISVLRVGPDEVWLRSSLVDRLVTAQSLLPRGTRLFVVDGHRTAERQRRHFDHARVNLRLDHPDWPAERVVAAADRYCTPADTAPHRTGGAVDLTLYNTFGPEVDLGAWEYNDLVPVLAGVSDNRRALAQVLYAVGLVNPSTAWWHWSYGDQYWCYRTGADAARYGPLDEPAAPKEH
jgi:D-alanyl-D-alanine dipeptidase